MCLTSKGHKFSIDTKLALLVFRFDKDDENDNYIASGTLPDTYINWSTYVLHDLTNFNTEWIREWVQKQHLLKNRYKI